ncbi:MAG: flippase-like domain-containing protein [Candidatus Omnitrophica bacterium]|nr:flippase-like domain-containing protein [Candidatus Omnitrophota bacterium]
MKRILQAFLFIIGIVLFAFVIKAVGFERLTVIFPALAGWGWTVFLFYLFMCFWDVLGWRILFDHQWIKKLNLWKLYWIRMVGEAVNNITPFIDVAGEFLKVVLVEKQLHVAKKSAVAAGVMSRSALLFAEIIFVVAGLAFASFVPSVPGILRVALIAAFIFCIAAGVLLIRTQKKGLFMTLISWVEHFGIDPKIFIRFHTSLQVIDLEIAKFYRHEVGRLWVSIGLHLIGWVSGGFEIFFMLRLLGVEVSLFEAVILESMIQLICTASFFIPGNLGVQEGGLALILGVMGVQPSLGVALSLMKRARQIIWTGIGFFVWGIFQLNDLKTVGTKS